jgi:hypothetical protein
MKHFLFWQRWILILCIIISLFGLVLAFFSQTPFFDFLFNNQINPVFFHSQDINMQTISFQNWIYGVLGSTIFGWGIFMTYIANYPFKRKEKWAWKCFAAGTLCWFIPDTLISLISGVIFNAVFNFILLLLIFFPLVFSRKFFNQTF